MLIVESHTGRAKVNKQLSNGIPCDSGHARSGSDAVTLNQRRHNPNPLLALQRVHIEHYA